MCARLMSHERGSREQLSAQYEARQNIFTKDVNDASGNDFPRGEMLLSLISLKGCAQVISNSCLPHPELIFLTREAPRRLPLVDGSPLQGEGCLSKRGAFLTFVCEKGANEAIRMVGRRDKEREDWRMVMAESWGRETLRGEN